MNRTIFSGIICGGLLLAGAAYAQDRPETVPAYTTQQFTHDWYAGQEKLWKAETERDPRSETAWFNYFKAARYAGFGDTSRDWKERSEYMAKLIESMGSAIPNTFTYHYVRWWNGGNDDAYFSDLEQGVREMARVVRPGGKVVILEITTPTKPPLSSFFSLWFDRIVPLMGRFDDAYTYLPNSVKRFPGPQALGGVLAGAGLTDVRWVLTAGGIIALHHGRVA